MFISPKICMPTNGFSKQQYHNNFIGIDDWKSYFWELQMPGRFCDIIEQVIIPRTLFI